MSNSVREAVGGAVVRLPDGREEEILDVFVVLRLVRGEDVVLPADSSIEFVDYIVPSA